MMKGLYSYLFLITAIHSILYTAEPRGKLYIQNNHAKLQFLCRYSVAGKEKGPITVYKDPVYLGLVSQISDVQVSRYGQLLGAGAKFYSYKDQLDICKKEPDKDWVLDISWALRGWGVTAQKKAARKNQGAQDIPGTIASNRYALEFFDKAYIYYTAGSKMEPRYMFDLGDTYDAAAVDENKERKIEQAHVEGIEAAPLAVIMRLAEISAQAAKGLLTIPDKNSAQYHQEILKWQDQLFPDRIKKGQEIACNILRGQADPTTRIQQDSYLQNIISLMWFLYSRAMAKNQAFEEGTFIIQDEQHRLYDYLMNFVKLANPTIKELFAEDSEKNISQNQYAYSRASSHFKREQKSTTYNGRHYGIDIRFTKAGSGFAAQALLPAQKSHILFGKIANNLIFIKFENVGIALQSAVYHGAEFVTAQARKQNQVLSESKYFEGTILQPITDSVQYRLGSDDDPNYRKEHPTREFVTACREAALAERLSPEQMESFMELAKEEGIHGILAKIDEELTKKPDSATWEQLKDYINKLETKDGLDHQDIRYGREVILIPQDIFGQCQ
jgi:hypothetical protein